MIKNDDDTDGNDEHNEIMNIKELIIIMSILKNEEH